MKPEFLEHHRKNIGCVPPTRRIVSMPLNAGCGHNQIDVGLGGCMRDCRAADGAEIQHRVLVIIASPLILVINLVDNWDDVGTEGCTQSFLQLKGQHSSNDRT